MTGVIGLLVRRELIDLLRDRRVVLSSILLPVLMYPAMLMLTNRLEQNEEARDLARRHPVAVTETGSRFADAVREHGGLELVLNGTMPPDTAAVRAGTIEAWLEFDDAETGDGQPRVLLMYYRPRDGSATALERLQEVADTMRARERERRFGAAGGRGDPDAALRVELVDAATPEEAGGARLGRMMPMLLMLTLFISGSVIATDTVAGERERGTLETLYLTPIDRTRIAQSKFIIITIATVLTGLLNLFSLYLSYRLGLIEPAVDGASGVSLSAVLLTVVLMVPLAALVGSVLLAVSAFARSLKEAQNMIVPLLLVGMIPGMLASSQDVELTPVTALIPVANLALAVRDAFTGTVSPINTVIVAIASIGWAFLVVRWTSGFLSRESTILGFEHEPLFARSNAGRRRAVMVGMAVSVLAYFYGGQLLQGWQLLPGLLLSLWVLLPLLGLGVLWLAWNGGPLRRLLSLQAPAPLALAGAALLGLATVVPMLRGVAELQSMVFPAPEALTEAFDELMNWSLPTMLFALALSPGICEEFVFRGVFLGLLRRTGSTRSAIVASSITFGVIHLSVFRFLPTFLLGLVLAALVVRTGSLLVPIVFHMVYNGTATLIGDRISDAAGPALALYWGASVVLAFAGIAMLRTARDER